MPFIGKNPTIALLFENNGQCISIVKGHRRFDNKSIKAFWNKSQIRDDFRFEVSLYQFWIVGSVSH